MKHVTLTGLVVSALALGLSAALAQSPRAIPRPPPTPPGPASPEAGSIATDGYAPIPAWAGQTRAPRPATTAGFDVQTFASGISGGFSFHFLPDGRIILAE